MNVKMIDCVGYFVKGAETGEQNGKPRMVKTPWSDEKMPIERAAEIGTEKVIKDHSSVAVLMTCDGSFGEIERKNFEKVEDRIVKELKELNKPFVIVLNSKEPTNQKTLALAKELEKKHKVGVVALNATTMTEQDVSKVFEKMLSEFPLLSVDVKMPNWLTALAFEHPVISEVVHEVKSVVQNAEKIGDLEKEVVLFQKSEHFEPTKLLHFVMGEGKIEFEVVPKPQLFYQVLSEQCNMQIVDDFDLVSKMKDLSRAKFAFDKMEQALSSANETGYGIVCPSMDEMVLDEPEVVKQGGKFGVKLHAKAPSLHIMRVDIETEISPIVGSEEQSKDLVAYLSEQSKENPNGVWDTNMFGKTLHEMMSEGLSQKLNAMPVEARKKMRKTLTRIVNEGKGGIICILL